MRDSTPNSEYEDTNTEVDNSTGEWLPPAEDDIHEESWVYVKGYN